MTSLTGNPGFGNTGSMNRSTATGIMKEKIPSGYSKASLQQFTPEMMQLFQSLFKHVSPGSYLSRLAGGEQGLFEEMEAPALRQFNALQGNIASRFSGMGSGARRSSGFQNTLSQASSEFAQDLASRRQQLQQQAILQLMGLGSNLLDQRPYKNYLVKNQQEEPSGIGNIIGTLIGGGAGAYFGGPQGAMVGANIGSNVLGGF